MEFLAPNLLWSLPLAGLPLLLYWWQRQQAEEMDYPSLAWLDDDFRKQLERTQQRHWLQVLWRVLLIVLLIYTLSQPVIGEEHSTSSEVIVFVDNSMSMTQKNIGQSGLEAAGEWIDNNLSRRVDEDNLRVGTVLPRPRILNPSNKSLGEAVTSLKPRAGAAQLKLIEQWYRQNSPSNRPRIIYFTDSQSRNYSRSTNSNFNRLVEIKTPFDRPNNHTISGASFTSKPQFVDQEAILKWTTEPADIEPSQVTIDGNKTLFPSKGRVRWTPDKTGYREVMVRLPNDSMEWDNRYRLVSKVRGTLNVLFLGQSKAINSTKFTLRNHIQTTTNPRDADVVIIGTGKLDVNNIQPLSDPQLKNVPKLILAGQQFDRRSFAELDSVLDVPWRIEGLVELDAPKRADLTTPAWFEGTNNVDKLINQLNVHSYYRTQSSANQQSIITLGDDPLFAQSGSWYLMALPPEQYLTPEAASTRWPTLLIKIIRGTIRSPSTLRWRVGKPVKFEQDFSFPVTIETPTDQRVTVNDPGTEWAPTEPGFYRIYGSEGGQSMKAVNYNPDEGNLSRLDVSDWPNGLKRYQKRGNQIHLSLAPWLWLLFMVGLGVDVWMGNRG